MGVQGCDEAREGEFQTHHIKLQELKSAIVFEAKVFSFHNTPALVQAYLGLATCHNLID
jgi:hypothetical protein